jgi:hypothetical protein
MDPITVAIVAAVTAGLAGVSEQAVADAYNGLKGLLRRKFGKDSNVVQAADEVETNPRSKSRPATLNEEVLATGADKDPELLAAAEDLLSRLKATPAGRTVVNQIVAGDKNIFSGTGNVTVHGPQT